MKKVYLYKQFERLWHWAQVIIIGSLIVTGFEIHSSYNLIGYENAVIWHNYAAWSFIVLIVFAIFWHFSTDEWKNYIPTTKNLKAQLNYYIFGIFRNAPHPTKKKQLSKLNPLQRLIYLALKIIVLPVMVGTGLVYFYFHYPVGGMEVRSLQPIAIIHTFGAYLLITFLIVHVYLITTGRTLTSNLKAMITGWEEMADEDTKEIIEEAIDDIGEHIKSNGGQKEEKEVKEILVEALNEIGVKVEHEEMKGQQSIKNKKKSHS
jgi:thiosulfate reductase cytochrome b subunit